MSRATRRRFTAEERATILRRHLADKVAVSGLCDEYKIQPSLFYVWHRQFMENMAAALEERRTRAVDTRQATAQQRIIDTLHARLQKKDSIIGFVSEEHLAL